MFIEVIGWIAYLFGPILCGVLVWDTAKGRARNSYWFFGGWSISETLAFIYVWNTGRQLPILACIIGCFVLLIAAAVIQYRREAKFAPIAQQDRAAPS